MSDYYGDSTLEDWLAEEVFCIDAVPINIVKLFEKWRKPVERSIGSWMDSDDGDGNSLSWRGWGRGFALIPENEMDELSLIVDQVKHRL